MLETVFTLANLFILPFWALMILLPHWRWTQRIMATLWPVVVLAVLYAILLLSQIGGAAAGWVHFLAFDLFVGRWAYLDSREQGISAWLVSPTLFFILMAGPLGLLLYLGIRGAVLLRQRR